MKMAQKTKMTNSRRTSRGPAVEKHCSRILGKAVKAIPITLGENPTLDCSAVVRRRGKPNVQNRTRQ